MSIESQKVCWSHTVATIIQVANLLNNLFSLTYSHSPHASQPKENRRDSTYIWAFLVVQWQRVHQSSRRCGFDPWVWKIPWRRKRLLTPESLPGKSHGQRSLADYSLWGQKESDTNERLSMHTNIFKNTFTATSRLVFAGTTGHRILAKLM